MKLLAMFFIVSVLVGCQSDKKQGHRVISGKHETGVKLVVLLQGGGTATLICPAFKGAPIGGHGRECYLDKG